MTVQDTSSPKTSAEGEASVPAHAQPEASVPAEAQPEAEVAEDAAPLSQAPTAVPSATPDPAQAAAAAADAPESQDKNQGDAQEQQSERMVTPKLEDEASVHPLDRDVEIPMPAGLPPLTFPMMRPPVQEAIRDSLHAVNTIVGAHLVEQGLGYEIALDQVYNGLEGNISRLGDRVTALQTEVRHEMREMQAELRGRDLAAGLLMREIQTELRQLRVEIHQMREENQFLIQARAEFGELQEMLRDFAAHNMYPDADERLLRQVLFPAQGPILPPIQPPIQHQEPNYHMQRPEAAMGPGLEQMQQPMHPQLRAMMRGPNEQGINYDHPMQGNGQGPMVQPIQPQFQGQIPGLGQYQQQQARLSDAQYHQPGVQQQQQGEGQAANPAANAPVTPERARSPVEKRAREEEDSESDGEDSNDADDEGNDHKRRRQS